MNTFTLVWSPTGQVIAEHVKAKSHLAAIRKAPMPYRKYKGEIYSTIEHTSNGCAVSCPICQNKGDK